MCFFYDKERITGLHSLVAQTVKSLSAMWETQVRFLGQEDPLEKEMAIHSSTLAWEIPWTEEPDRLQSMGSQRVRHNWATSISFFLSFVLNISVNIYYISSRHTNTHIAKNTRKKGFPGGTSGKEPACQYWRRKRYGFNSSVGKVPWRRKWDSTAVFLPGESPWTEEPVRLRSMGSHRVGHDRNDLAHTHSFGLKTNLIQAAVIFVRYYYTTFFFWFEKKWKCK